MVKQLPTIISNLPTEQRRILQCLNISHIDKQLLLDMVRDGNIFLLSDGTIQGEYGTHGYLLTDIDRTQAIEGMGIVPITSTEPLPQ